MTKRFEAPQRRIIDGVKTKRLTVNADERGRLMELLRYRHGQPDEFRLDAHDPSIPYDWSRKDG